MMARMIASAMLAQDDGLGGGGMIFMLGAMFLIMYLLVFRPQRKQEKARKAMIAAVKKNDRVLFTKYGGNLGADGSVGYLFNQVGLITFAPGLDEERVMEAALEAGAARLEQPGAVNHHG